MRESEREDEKAHKQRPANSPPSTTDETCLSKARRRHPASRVFDSEQPRYQQRMRAVSGRGKLPDKEISRKPEPELTAGPTVGSSI